MFVLLCGHEEQERYASYRGLWEITSSSENMAKEGKTSWTWMQVKRSSWRLGQRTVFSFTSLMCRRVSGLNKHVKGIVHPKIEIMSLFTHPNVSKCDFLSFTFH